MHGEDKEPAQIEDERFERLMFAFIKAEVVQPSERLPPLDEIKIYRREQEPGWKVWYCCELRSNTVDVSPEELYGWMWENPKKLVSE